MSRNLIAAMGHVAMQTTKLDESIAVATELLGLRLTGQEGDQAFLSAAEVHHELMYIQSKHDAVDHFGLAAANDDALVEVRERVQRAGYRIVSETVLEAGLGDGFAFEGPEGFTFEIYVGAEDLAATTSTYGPERYGHINLHASDPVAMKDFLVDVLGFRISDIIGDNALFFLRCNPEHHGIAVGAGHGTLHHHAWQAQSIADLGHLADRLDRVRRELLWGPVRHGAGHNIATYFAEPGGSVIELYADMELIFDDERPPVRWDGDDRRWYSRWADYRPEGFRDYGAFPASKLD